MSTQHPLTFQKAGCMLALTPGLKPVGDARKLQDRFLLSLHLLSVSDGIEMEDEQGNTSIWKWDANVGAWQQIIS